MTTICLIRHGETDHNRQGLFQGNSDVPLNDVGRQQAQDSADAVRHSTWDLILTSPLKRARETAEIVAARLDIGTIRIVDEFIERDLGVASGHRYAEVDAAYPDGNIPGLEPLDSVRDRAMLGFAQAVAEYQGKCLIIVAHAYVINAILYTVSNGAFGSAGIPRIRNGYVATLTRSDREWSISEGPAT